MVGTVRGLEGYTTNFIAERAGVSIGSLYQYFSNKDSITIALIARESTQLLADFGEAAAILEWRPALVKMVAAGVTHQMRRPRLARLLDIEKHWLPNRTREHDVASVIHPSLVALLQSSQKKLVDEADVVAFDLMAITRGNDGHGWSTRRNR